MASFSFAGANTPAWLAGLLESAMDAIITADEGQRIVLYNRAAERIFGWPAEVMQGEPLTKLLPQRYRGGHGEHVRRFGVTGTSSRRMSGSAVVYGLRANGEEFPVDASISKLDTPDGRFYTVILRDITERVQAQEELAALAAGASGVREQEKARVARELHDELAQALTAMKMDTSWLLENLQDRTRAEAKLREIQVTLDQTIAATRRIAADLRPMVLDDLGLLAGIEWLAQNFIHRTGSNCLLDVDGELELGEPHATVVFRIVQEALANVAKHARAKRVQVRVHCTGGTLAVSVDDDGRGFQMGDPRKPLSIGLVGMRERARLLRGCVTVTSAPGQGTRVEARLPLQAQ